MGGQSIPDWDFVMSDGINISFTKHIIHALKSVYGWLDVDFKSLVNTSIANGSPLDTYVSYEHITDEYRNAISDIIKQCDQNDINVTTVDRLLKVACDDTVEETHQAMEAAIHNLNTLNSRAGSQVPFSSINFGMCTTDAGRLAIKETLNAIDAGMGNGETAIFPVSIFIVKDGVNYNPGDPNYDLFMYSIEVSSKRLYPNWEFLDAPFNLQYYKAGDPTSYVATMGCRTRVMGNINGPEITHGRGNLSFSTINLPQIALKHRGDVDGFMTELDELLKAAEDQLYERYLFQCNKKVKNFPFMAGEGLYIDSEKYGPDDYMGEFIKNGTLSIGFIGLADALVALIGKHHGESAEAQELGLKIVGHMREYCDNATKRTHLNYTLLATPAEGLSGTSLRANRKMFGIVPGVTDKDYHVNSFHVPPAYPISAFDKIEIEAPYHALCNAGHISYVELDGDPSQNIEAVEDILRWMHDCGIGYGSINHPVDYDPVCGYVGIIGDTCPRCGRKEFEGVPIERLKHLGVWKEFNSTTIGYHGDNAEETDRVPNLYITKKED